MENSMIYKNVWGDKEVKDAKNLQGPILITGVSGFIGANLFYSLSQCRNDVYGFSRRPKYSWRLSMLEPDKASRLFSLDITDYQKLSAFIHWLKPRTVLVLSAYGSYSRQTDVQRIHTTNYIGAMNIINAISETGCEAFVHAGSSSEYGLNCNMPKENNELIPNSNYAVSKVGVAYMIKYYGKILQLPCVNLRIYSVYGPWEERDRLIPNLVSNCLRGGLPNFVEKDISRDFLYIDDCTHAVVRTALSACRTHPGESINIATGIKTTISELANTAKQLFKVSEQPVFGSMPNRKWDLSNWIGDPSLAKNILAWQYKVPLKKGLAMTAEWERMYTEALKYVSLPLKLKKISVIIACYKDEKAIPILHERLTNTFQKTGYDYEIIFVNDASPLGDEAVIQSLSDRDYHVIGISHSRNFGSQSAFLSGIEIANGDAVVLMDGDGQDPPEVIPDFIQKWEEGFEVIYGQRNKRKAPLFMAIFYKVFYRIFKRLADIDIPLDAGDFSLIDRKAINNIMRFPEKDVFLRGLRAWIGFKQTGVPYVRPERLFGKSTNNLFKNIWWAKKAIFSFSMKPLNYIQSFGVAVFIGTVILSIYYLVYYFIKPPVDARGIPTIILLVLGLAGVQLICLSIIGDYISKIVEEVKNRPRFIRNNIIMNGKVFEREEKISEVLSELSRQRDI